MVDTDDGRQTTPGVWHKLPTGELKMLPNGFSENKIAMIYTKVNSNLIKSY